MIIEPQGLMYLLNKDFIHDRWVLCQYFGKLGPKDVFH